MLRWHVERIQLGTSGSAGLENMFKMTADRVATKQIIDRQQAQHEQWAYRIQEYNASDDAPPRPTVLPTQEPEPDSQDVAVRLCIEDLKGGGGCEKERIRLAS